MRKIFPLFLIGALFTACIDKDYDLENIDTDNVTIGGDESKFEIPLARVLVTLDEITSSNGTDIDEIFSEADTWLPTLLPNKDDNGHYADVQKLLHNKSYVEDELLPALIAQMGTDDKKLNDVADLLQRNYYAAFSNLLPGVSEEQFKQTFVTTFKENDLLREQLATEVENLAGSYLTGIDADVEELSYDVERIDISDDIIKMLTDNLDPKGTANPRNTLYLAGSIDNRLPIALNIAPDFTGTDVSFSTGIEANRDKNALPDTQLFAEDMQQIVRGVTIKIPVDLKKYYPGKGFDKGTDEDGKPVSQITLNLHLIKNGGLKLDI